jgi:hypothetical protein
VNGKAIVNGVNLLEMELSEMLDVIHYFYEEDLNFSSHEQLKMAEQRRIHIYREMYLTEYKYALTTSSDEVVPFDPAGGGTKSYIPPTEFNPDSSNPFGSVLDAPIG